MSQDKKINISLKKIDSHSLAEKRKQSLQTGQATPIPIQNILNTPIPELLQQYISTQTPLPESLQKIVQQMRQTQQSKSQQQGSNSSQSEIVVNPADQDHSIYQGVTNTVQQQYVNQPIQTQADTVPYGHQVPFVSNPEEQAYFAKQASISQQALPKPIQPAEYEAIPIQAEASPVPAVIKREDASQSIHTNAVQEQSNRKALEQEKSKSALAVSQTPIPKNSTVQRALEAFLGDQPINTTELNKLQLSNQSISVQRQNLIDQIIAQKDGRQQQELIKELKSKFGLGSDLRILYLSLDHENEGIGLEAFKSMEALITHMSDQSKVKINAKITQIELRSFQPKILEACQRLKALLRSKE